MPNQLDALREHVRAACDEFDAAIIYFGAWKSALDDPHLPDRLGVSFATNTFRTVITALRRELLMAMMRLWDKDRRAIGLPRIAAELRDTKIIQLLVEARAPAVRDCKGVNNLDTQLIQIAEAMRETLDETNRQFLAIANRYENGGPDAPLLKKLMVLRNERLAHFQVQAVSVPEKNATDQEIENFYYDNAEMTRLLRSLVLAERFDPHEAGGVHQDYAKFFWASVRGERTEGHPNFKRPPAIPL